MCSDLRIFANVVKPRASTYSIAPTFQEHGNILITFKEDNSSGSYVDDLTTKLAVFHYRMLDIQHHTLACAQTMTGMAAKCTKNSVVSQPPVSKTRTCSIIDSRDQELEKPRRNAGLNVQHCRRTINKTI